MSSNSSDSSEGLRSENSIEQLCKKLESSRDIALSALDRARKEIEESFSALLCELKNTENNASKSVKESISRAISTYGCFYDNEYPVVVGFKESPLLYSIEMKYLKRYPSNRIYKSFMERTDVREDGVVVFDHDETLFTVILSYLKGEPIDYNEIGEEFMSLLYDDFVYYCIPVPVPLLRRKKQKDIERIWNRDHIPVEVDHKMYTVDRERLSEMGIVTSGFQCPPPSWLTCKTGSETLQCNEKHVYFKYVIDYIQTGQLNIDQVDVQNIDMIQQEFKNMGIHVRESEWRHFIPLSLYFPGSLILDEKWIQVLLNWVGKDKKWKLLYQYVILRMSRDLYRGSRDGFTAGAFHEKCDKKGETITIIRNEDNGQKNIFGGYSSKSWLSSMGPNRSNYVSRPLLQL